MLVFSTKIVFVQKEAFVPLSLPPKDAPINVKVAQTVNKCWPRT